MAELNDMFGGSGGSKVKSRQMVSGNFDSKNPKTSVTHTIASINIGKTIINTIMAYNMVDMSPSGAVGRASTRSIDIINSTSVRVNCEASETASAGYIPSYYQFELVEYE